jgi:type II secretory pathway component PulF
VIGLVAAVVGVRMWVRREGSGVVIDRFLLRVPYLGGLMRMYATSQLTRTLAFVVAGMLLAFYLPLFQAIAAVQR